MHPLNDLNAFLVLRIHFVCEGQIAVKGNVVALQQLNITIFTMAFW